MALILLDVDQVVADLHPAWLGRYNEEWGDSLTVWDIKSWDIDKWVKPECGRRVYRILEEPGLYERVMPINGSKQGVAKLREWGHRVVFLTAAGPEGAKGKLRWLKDWGYLPSNGGHPWRDVVTAADKSLVHGDVLVDDHVANLRSASVELAILFDQPHNRETDWLGRRASGWLELLDLLDTNGRSVLSP